MASKSLEDLVPELKEKCIKLQELSIKNGLSFIVTSTARTIQEQVALYAQGRELLENTNKLRKLAGLYQITAAENKNKVTWTLASKHIIDLNDTKDYNDKARAFDIALLDENKKISWDAIKLNVNKNQKADYIELGELGESLGLKWGGRFKKPDMPHFELKE